MRSDYQTVKVTRETAVAHVRPAVDVVAHIRSIVGDGIPFWLAGGALASLKGGDPVNDWDIFSSEPIKLVTVLEAKLGPDSVTFRNNHVVNFKFPQIEETVQVITRQFDDPISCIMQFDFTICCAALDDTNHYRHPDFTHDMETQRLRGNCINYPLNTIKRIIKYAGRGFEVDTHLLIDTLKGINDLSINYDSITAPDFYLSSV